MATYHRWSQPASEVTVLSATDLSSLASTNVAISNAFDNTGTRWPLCSFELQFEFATAPTANRLLKVYILYSFDGTNFSDGAETTTVPKTEVAWSAAVWNDVNQHFAVSPPIELAPFQYKILLENDTNTALEASGTAQSILNMKFWGYESY